MKVVKWKDEKYVKYDEKHWEIFHNLRRKALKIMSSLAKFGFDPIVHGSVARGDVHENSDVDIVIPYLVNPLLVEQALEWSGFHFLKKEIAQATPKHAIKASIYLDEKTLVTFPLSKLSRLEREFYKFGGEIGLDYVKQKIRVPGVNKKLLIIIPVKDGHIEYSIIGRELEVADILGVSLDIIKERIYILTRRDEKGRTGVFVHKELHPEASISEAAREIALRNPMFRRKLSI